MLGLAACSGGPANQVDICGEWLSLLDRDRWVISLSEGEVGHDVYRGLAAPISLSTLRIYAFCGHDRIQEHELHGIRVTIQELREQRWGDGALTRTDVAAIDANYIRLIALLKRVTAPDRGSTKPLTRPPQ